MNWMARLKRVSDIDLSQCPNRGARLRVIGVSLGEMRDLVIENLGRKGPPWDEHKRSPAPLAS